MCGIVGYVGYRQALPVLLDSLQRVEYRGYDSCGVAVLNSRGIQVVKQLGEVQGLARAVPPLEGSLGLGHCRWATVGRPSVENAHPHLDCQGGIAVVHNGDIDNYQPLRRYLLERGHRFRSDTDTEVIAHLIEEHDRGDILEAVRRATGELRGTYALALVSTRAPFLIAVRRENPLVLGLGSGEMFLASDAVALLQYTDRVIYLEDGDVALLSATSVRIWQNGAPVRRRVHRIPWRAREAGGLGYQHHMLKEIHEGPAVVRNALAGRLPWEAASPRLPIDPPFPPSRLLLLGCGTSYHAALLGEGLLSSLLPIPVRAVVASEFRPQFPLEGTWVVALSQSGETADTLSAVRQARERGAWVLGVTNVRGSSLTRVSDAQVYLEAGPEVAVAATKSFLAQLVVLYLLGLYLAPSDLAGREGLHRGLRTLPRAIQEVLNRQEELAALGRWLASHEHLFIIARGLGVPVALEGALKFKEVAYMHAEGCPAGELKHGPFALLTPTTPVIALILEDPFYPRMLTAVKEIRSRDAPVLALTYQGDGEVHGVTDPVFSLPRVDPLLSPFLHTVALQLLAYHAGVSRGCPIDKPRNLAKSVTVP